MLEIVGKTIGPVLFVPTIVEKLALGLNYPRKCQGISTGHYLIISGIIQDSALVFLITRIVNDL